MISLIDGYKTYIVGGLTVLYGIAGYVIGQLDFTGAIGFVLAGLTAFGARSAVQKVIDAVKILKQ